MQLLFPACLWAKENGKKEEVITIIFPSKYCDTPIIPMNPEADAGGL